MNFRDMTSEQKIKFLATLDEEQARKVYDRGECSLFELASAFYPTTLLTGFTEEETAKEQEEHDRKTMESHIRFASYAIDHYDGVPVGEIKTLKGLYHDFVKK